MEEITVSDGSERSSFITYLYNAVVGEAVRQGGSGELLFGDDRTALRLRLPEGGKGAVSLLFSKIAEVVGIGYKYLFLREKLKTQLSSREEKLLSAALIAADLEGDLRFIRGRMEKGSAFHIDGFYSFRLAALREKWTRIAEYVPVSFSSADLKKFCEFLVGESTHKIYLKGNVVFGENFAPLRRSRLTGEEDVETEILLSDAGFVYCLGEVDGAVGDFLQKYYADRAIFS